MAFMNTERTNRANNYQKFKRHLKTGGILYAFGRGIGYLIFLINKQRTAARLMSENMLIKGRLKIVIQNCGIKIFWRDVEITRNNGLNVAINTLGLWTDSTNADWQILQKSEGSLNVKAVFRNLPISLIWSLEIKNEQEIEWRIDADIEEWLYIDEFRIACFINPDYKTWFSDYKYSDFRRLDNNWHDLYFTDLPVSLVGVRFPVEGKK